MGYSLAPGLTSPQGGCQSVGMPLGHWGLALADSGLGGFVRGVCFSHYKMIPKRQHNMGYP